MNSRQRILNAINRKPVDHVPLYLRLWSLGEGIDQIPFNWRDQITRVESLLKLGVDDTLVLQPPMGYTEEFDANQIAGIQHTITKEEPYRIGDYPILRKTYQTPDGPLSTGVKITRDWPHGNDIMLFSDFNIPRLVDPLVKSLADIPRLKHLLGKPDKNQMDEFLSRAQYLHKEAARLEVVLDGGWTALGDSAVWLCGMDNVLTWQMEQPDLLDAVLEVILDWELTRMDILLSAGVDVMVHMAWYEGTDFWTPKNYRRMLKPRLQKLIDASHAKNVPFRYIITKGWKPLRKDFIEIGIDCVTGVDPVQDNADLEEVKNEFLHKICIMGGVNAAVMLTQWSEQEIRDAIDKAFQILNTEDGFILFPVDNIHCELPWEKTEILIDQWKKHWVLA
jgi:uroporphyrinogen-III decarboxylase